MLRHHLNGIGSGMFCLDGRRGGSCMHWQREAAAANWTRRSLSTIAASRAAIAMHRHAMAIGFVQ